MPKITYSTIAKRSDALNAVHLCNENSSSMIRDYVANLEACIKEDFNNGKKLSSRTVKAADLAIQNINHNIYEATSYGATVVARIGSISGLDKEQGARLEKDFCTFVLPYCENMDSIQREAGWFVNFNLLNESVKAYAVADRILANHKKISEKFNFNLLEGNIYSRNVDYICDEVCAMIDGYNIRPSAKINATIEEMTYLLDKNGLEYDKKHIVKKITEYFVVTSGAIDEKELGFVERTLKEGYCVDPEDSEEVAYIFSQDAPDTDTVAGAMKGLVLGQVSLDPAVFHDLGMKFSRTDVKNNLSEMLDMVAAMEGFDKITPAKCGELIKSLCEGIIEAEYERDPLGKVIYLKECSNQLSKFVKREKIREANNHREYNIGSKDIDTSIENYISEAQNSFVCIESYYNDNNIQAIRFVNEGTQVVSLNEAKFNLTNLVKAAINMSNYIKLNKMVKNTRRKLKRHKFIAKAKNVLFGEAGEELYRYLGSDDRLDVCTEQILFEDDAYALKLELEDACEEFNRIAASKYPNVKAYFIMTEGLAEVHIKDRTIVSLTEAEREESKKYISPELESYIEMLGEAGVILETAESVEDNVTIESVVENASILYPDDFCQEAFDLAYEALVYSGADEDSLNEFTELCGAEVTGKVDLEDELPIDIKLEACELFVKVCEEAPVVKKPKVGGTINKKTEVKKDDKPKGVNWDAKLNSLKLAMEGLKAKFKDMSHKEQEVSKNLDNAATRFVKAMKDAMISDRREAIIKGSVIPSFSKCIKIGLALAGIGGISLATVGTVLPAVIIALGGFAMSKNLTRKERLLLLDDIETELDVIDKEIALAESRNQMKKYRKLLKIRKDLQRQYQRIKYNVRVGKDILPGSTVGIKMYNNQ